ncbi:MAG: glycoside hydrolase family 3, partial [Sphingobacteriales bacterium]
MRGYNTPFKYFVIFILILLTNSTFAQKADFIQSLSKQNRWVDSVYDNLSKKERVAQLLFVRAHTNKGKAYEDSVEMVIKKQHIGGLVFFQGGPGRQAALTNRYQKAAEVPLLIAMDGEWGVGMRLDSCLSYPYQMTLGAIQDNNLIYKMGQFIAADFKRLGMHMNFSPVMDINNNPNNPVINYRSFGDNKYNVAKKGVAYFKGMQDAGILTSAKHFPGHGSSTADSHEGFVDISKTWDPVELEPYKALFAQGYEDFVMVGHLFHSGYAGDGDLKLPASLSPEWITDVLRNELAFKGVVISDDLEMGAIREHFGLKDTVVRAVRA